jgi:hypothetical protein
MKSTGTPDDRQDTATSTAPVLHKVSALIRKLDRIETTSNTQPVPGDWN